jgi:NAD-reducing hydrogenase small subunit
MSKARLATVWLDGCSGCHMSFFDIDERMIDLATKVDLVYSPLVDQKDFPEGVDIALVEGAVSSEEDLRRIQLIRERSRVLVSLGDCAVTSNVPGMRNLFDKGALLRRAYIETAALQAQIPTQVVPALLPRARPVHEVVKVDVFVPGCPPSADTIFHHVNRTARRPRARPYGHVPVRSIDFDEPWAPNTNGVP